VPNALPPGDLAVWDGHDAMVVGDGMMIKAGAPSGCRRSGPTNAGQGFQGFCVRPRERQPASWHLLDHLKVTFKAKRCRQGAVGYLKFWSRGSSRRAVAHGERNRNTITSTPRNRSVGAAAKLPIAASAFPAPRFKASPVLEAN